MSNHSNQSLRVSCFNEYDVLKTVVLCEPKYMTIKDTINDTQEHFKDVGINIDKAMKQHRHFVSVLKEYGIEVILLPPYSRFPEQVFTRDIGFTLGETVYVSEMASYLRQGEENELITWLNQQNLSHYNLTGDRIEGGDVIIDQDNVYVGLSNRTNIDAINHLTTLLPDFNVLPVPFTDKYLHLDCVFNILSPSEALVFPGEINYDELKILEKRYDFIEVSEEEQFTLGTNVLSIGNKRVLSLPVNKNVNKELRSRGYEVIEVDLTEIIKSGGAFRCCSLPILREKGK